MHPDNKTIGSLVNAVRQGNSSAKEELILHTYKKVLFQCDHILKNQNHATNVVINSYTTAFANLEQLKQNESFPSWVSALAMNQIRNILADQRRPAFLTTETDVASMWQDIPVVDFKPAESTDYSKAKGIANTILTNLPDDQRMCILLYLFEKMPVKQMGYSIGVSETVVMAKLQLAMQYILQNKTLLEQSTGLDFTDNTFYISFFSWLVGSLCQDYIVPTNIMNMIIGQIMGIAPPPAEFNDEPSAAPKKKKGKTGMIILLIIIVLAIAAGIMCLLYLSKTNDIRLPFISPKSSESETVSSKEEDREDRSREPDRSLEESSSESSSSKSMSSSESSDEKSSSDIKKPDETGFDTNNTFCHDFQDFIMYFPLELMDKLTFKELPKNNNWQATLEIYYRVDKSEILIAKIGYDYHDNESSLMERYERDFELADDATIKSWGVVDKGNSVWDKVGIYPLAFRTTEGVPYYIEWYAVDYLNQGGVKPSDSYYDEFSVAQKAMKDCLYHAHIYRDIEDNLG